MDTVRVNICYRPLRICWAIPIGANDALDAFKKRFSHLITPFFPDGLFLGSKEHGFHAHLLDVQNALVELDNSPALKSIKKSGFRLYDDDDPLADVFLMQFGRYPDVTETGLDYRAMVKAPRGNGARAGRSVDCGSN